MAERRGASDPPPDVDGDDCLGEYRHLFSPDILAGRVAFITGGGSGIGFRIAEIFMRHGCRTAIAGRNQQRVAEAWTQCCRRGLTRAEQRGTITSLSLLATPLLMKDPLKGPSNSSRSVILPQKSWLQPQGSSACLCP